MRIAFLGTPDFALPSLRMLIMEGHTLCVFTQPDKPRGRHAALTPSPVKALAEQHGIPVYQPKRIRDAQGQDALLQFAPELMVTAAFGQMLSAENLSAATYGCINVHGSLLPKYRGAAPIQWAIIEGETITGITAMQTDIGLDTGDILLQKELAILPDETAGELSMRMAQLGAETLQETIAMLEQGTLPRKKQDEDKATYCSLLKKEDGKLDFNLPAQHIHNRVRGVNPWPGAFAILEGASLKIWRTHMTEEPLPESMRPGTCFGGPKTGLFAACADRAIEITELQAQGGKQMDAKAFLRGRPLMGARLL